MEESVDFVDATSLHFCRPVPNAPFFFESSDDPAAAAFEESAVYYYTAT